MAAEHHKRWHPYLTARPIHKGPNNELGVIPPKKWPYTPRHWVAFGTAAAEDPESNDRWESKQHKMANGQRSSSFTMRPTGKRYYRFPCTPLTCGKKDCQRNSIMTSFPPYSWDLMEGFPWGWNPMDPGSRCQGVGYFVERDGGQLVWNTERWGDGPPPNWGQDTAAQEAAAQEAMAQEAAAQEAMTQEAMAQEAVAPREGTQDRGGVVREDGMDVDEQL